MNTMVVAIIVLIVLVVIIGVFTGLFGDLVAVIKERISGVDLCDDKGDYDGDGIANGADNCRCIHQDENNVCTNTWVDCPPHNC